jgi:hypothetical protein
MSTRVPKCRYFYLTDYSTEPTWQPPQVLGACRRG